MPIRHFIWTSHAKDRCTQKLIDRSMVERAIQDHHANRKINRGRADWRLDGLLVDGRRFEVVYDHPSRAGNASARIVSVWDR